MESVNTAGNFGGCTGVGAYGTADTIALPAGTYPLALGGGGENANQQGTST